MSVRDSKDVVRDFLSAARQGDRASMADLLHPQVEIHEAGSLPFAGVHRGLEGFQALTRQVFTRFIGTQVSIERLFAQGDTVVVEMRLSGRCKRSGDPFEMPVLELWDLEDARIRRITPFYYDTAKMIALIGS